MPIPADIYKLELTGHWEDQTGPVAIPRWPFAMTWYVRSTQVTDDPTMLGSYAAEFGIWLAKGNGGTEFVADGTVITKARGIRLASEAFGDFGVKIESATGITPPVPPQVSLFVVGRTNKLGRQTRKWIPCVQTGFLDAFQPRFNVTFGGPLSLQQWAFDSLTPKQVGPIATLTPIVWDAAAEEAHDITQVRVQAWPRSIRRRSLRAPDEWFVM